MSDEPRQPLEGPGHQPPGQPGPVPPGAPEEPTTEAWAPGHPQPDQPPQTWPGQGQPPQGQPQPDQPPQTWPGQGQAPQGWAQQGQAPPGVPPQGWGYQGQPPQGQPPQGQPPQGYGPPGSWAPAHKRQNPLAGLVQAPPRQLAALAALLAATLVTLGAVFLFLISADDFDFTFGDRLRIATSVITFTVPLLLAAALLLREGAAQRASVLHDATFALVGVVVGAVASVLLFGRLLANLFAGDDAFFASGFEGFAGRLSTFLADLAAVVLAAALTWWALQVRKEAQPAVAPAGYGPAPQPPPPGAQQWGQPPAPPGQQWGQGYQPGPGPGSPPG